MRFDRETNVYPKPLIIRLLTASLVNLTVSLKRLSLTITDATIRNARWYHLGKVLTEKKKRMDVLRRVVRMTNQVRISSKASKTCSRLSFLFSVPPWSSLTRSSAAIFSSGVNIFACTGESGSQINTQIPTTMAKPPRRIYMILYGASK